MQDVLQRGHKKKWIPAAKDSAGVMHVTRTITSDLFADFLESCIRILEQQRASGRTRVGNASVTMEEVRTACNKMQRRKTCSDDGLVAEMLQTGHAPLLHAIADLFTDILNGRKAPPDTWRKTRLVAIFIKGDPSCPSNYRPIATLPVLYKLFATVLLGRVKHTPD